MFFEKIAVLVDGSLEAASNRHAECPACSRLSKQTFDNNGR